MEKNSDLKLLYVEDDEMSRELIHAVLEHYFENIITAVDGIEGLEKFKQNDIDLVITDITMPKMNGLELATELKKINPDTPVLVFSAHNESEYFLESIKLGVEGYLLKPIDIKQFEIVVSKTVQSIKIRQENIEYKNSLELKVAKQIEDIREKDRVLMEQSKMADMGEMVDVVAHQWKQPINLIYMYDQMIGEILSDNEPDIEDLKRYQELIGKQIDHLNTTIDEFRKFFRTDISVQPIALGSTLASIELLLKDELIKKQVTLEIECGENLFVNSTENDLKHLLINLINNAKDEMVNAQIDQKDRLIKVKCKKVDEETVIEVKDNGLGIPEDIIDDIFKLNFTTKEESGGTGVGLYICKLIADKYGADIEVYNEGGAVFKVTF